MPQNNKIIEDSTKYTIGTIVAQIIGIFTSVLTRRYLTPEMMGIWASLLLILSYASFAHLGLFTAAEIRIPYLKGRNEFDHAQRVRNTAFTFSAAVSSLILVVLFIASFVLKNRLSNPIILGIRMMTFIIMATLFYNLYIGLLRGDKNFSLLSKSTVFNSLATLLFVSTLAYFLKLKGLYFATLIATATSVLYIVLNTRYTLKLYFNLGDIFSLAKVGLPLIVAGLIYTVLLSIDKIMIIKMIGMKELGFYSIAILALTYTHAFPKVFGIVITPNMQEEFGRTNSRQHIMGLVKQPSIIMAYIFPILLAAAYFVVPLLVYYVMPKYVLGIESMKILLAGCFFLSLVPLAQNFVIAINKQIILLPLTAFAVGLGIGINYIMIKLNYGINGVALGTSVTYFVYFLITFIYTLKHCDKWQQTFLFFAKIITPFTYALFIILFLGYFFPAGSSINKTLLQASIFYLAYFPMLIYINKKAKVLLHIIEMISKKKPI